MSKKLILFLMVLLFGSTSFLRADEVVIGDGTATTYYAPFNSLWGYSFVEQVYYADEIGMAGTINSISFNMSETDAVFTSEFDIFMKNVSRDAFASSTDFEPVVAGDMVFSGEISFQPGWTTITLDAPFAYDGTSNLMIGVHEKNSGYSTRYFYYTSVTGALISGHSDSVDPNPYDMGSYTGTTYTQNYRANIILDITAGGGGGGGTIVEGEITIHDGTGTNGYVPVYGFYADAYLKAEMVYPAADFEEMAGLTDVTINSMKFYATQESVNWGAANFQVFVKEVADATISDFAGPGTVVYEGALSIAGNEMLVTFTTPYQYNGGNLLVGVYNTVKGSYVSTTWNGETVDGASVQGYSYGELSGISATQRNFLPKATFTYVGTEPVGPTGPIEITPSPIALGYRPNNGWMEPLTLSIRNNDVPVTITAIMSETTGAIVMDPAQIEDYVLDTDEEVSFTVTTTDVAAGEYAEQFTMFVVNNDRDITVVPATATIYEAGVADIVETAATIEGLEFSDTPTDLHANYNLYGMTEMKTDAVYYFAISDDYHFHAVGGDDFIAVYNKADIDENNLTAAVEPVVLGTNGTIDDEILLGGQYNTGEYYLVVASENITDVYVTFTAIEPATEIVNLGPADGATEVEAPVVLTWEGGLNATEYQVLFGTSPVNMDVILDWTMIDENYGTYTVTSVDNNTQYFWQINVRNSHGTVEGERWGFTTTLNSPFAVTATPDEIFTNESTLIKWKHSDGQGGFEGDLTVCDGTETSSYIPVYGLWMDDYTRGEMIYPAEMLEEMQGGEINKLTYYISSSASGAWTGDVFNVYLMEVENTTISSYYTSANATIVYTGALDGQGTTMVINFDTPYTYEGGNLLVGIEETVCGTYKSCYFYGVAATGASASGYSSSALASVAFTQRDFLPKTTFTCGDAKGGNRNFLGYNIYNDGVKVNDELIHEKQYTLSNLEYNMEGHEIAVTAVYSEGESPIAATGNSVDVYVSGYGIFTGDVRDLITNSTIAGVTVRFNGTDEFGNTVAYEGTTDDNGEYTINNVKAGTYTGMAQLEGYENAFVDATLAYNTTEEVNFIIHEEYNPVLSVVAEEMDPELARVKWSMNVVIPAPTPGGGGQSSGDEFFENFDNSAMPAGWTSIDADGDGYNWKLASVAMGTGYGHNGSADCILSQSYDNNYGVLYPDNYLVTPQVTVGSTSTFSFYACAQDASYAAEHFGVAVSTGSATAADFTMVEEWTMTAKGSGVMAPGRDGQTRAQGTWYEKTVDLSAYAGQQIYIAIRHFNCSDMFYLDVDDIALSNGSKGTRNVAQYAVYRKAILKENALVEADSVYFGNVAYPDTLYADFTWANMEAGLYQYGVSAHYPEPAKGGNRATIVYNFEDGTIPAEFNNTSAYPWAVADGNGGKVMKSTNAGVASSTGEISLTVNFPTDGTFSFDAECMGEGTSSIWDKCTFSIDGAQQFQYGANVAGWNNYSYDIVAGEHTFTWSYSKDSSVNPTGDYFAVDNVTVEYVGGGDTNDDPITPITWSNILPKDMETTVTVTPVVPDAETAEGVNVRFTNTFENLVYTYTFGEGETSYVFEEFRKGNYIVTVDLEGYTSDYAQREVSIWDETEIAAVLTEIYKPIDELVVSVTGYAMWTPVVPVDRYPEKYFVQIDGVYVAETTDNFMDLTEVAELVENQTYTVSVAVVYSTGMSAYIPATFTYLGCEGVATQVEDLHVDEETSTGLDVVLVWNGGTPNPNPNPNPGATTTYDFESGMMGWTSIDADGDGYNWNLSSSTMGTGYGHNGSSDMVFSQSYDNNYGVLYPDNYLVSPAKGAYSSISFYACGQDASYAAEHFGVAVSTTSATASAFTMVQEWTMTAKGSGVMAPGRDGQTRVQGTWYEYNVDLSAYAGQEIWIAIRHFNCSDMFYLDVDDITLSAPAKLGGTLEMAGEGFGAAANQMTRDWYYYDNGSNEDAIGTGGGNFWWGVMFPAGSYEGTQLTKVAAYDYMAMTGNVTIYQGGTSAPAGSSLGQTNVTFTGSEDFVEFTFAEPVTLDPSQNVWVIFYNGSAATYPAAVCNNTGDANGRWVSLDGSTWADLASYGLDYTFMVRAFIEAGGPAPVTPTGSLTPNAYNIAVDDIENIVGAVTTTTAVVTAEDYDEHTYYVFYVDAQYGMSCPAQVTYACGDMVDETEVVNAIYPNPTSGDLHIYATAMTSIRIVNAMGQVVYEQEVNADEMVIDMAKFGAGVYMVSIVTENGTNVKRVTVTK